MVEIVEIDDDDDDDKEEHEEEEQQAEEEEEEENMDLFEMNELEEKIEYCQSVEECFRNIEFLCCTNAE